MSGRDTQRKSRNCSALGADQVIPEEFETSIEIFSRVLHEYHVPGNIIANQIQMVRFGGYKMLRGCRWTRRT